MDAVDPPARYYCRICQKRASDRTALTNHLKLEHEILEVLSFSARTMMAEEDRDADAARSFAGRLSEQTVRVRKARRPKRAARAPRRRQGPMGFTR